MKPEYCKKSLLKLIVVFFVSQFLITGCKQMDLYEKNTNIPQQQWQRNVTATGSIAITDTGALYKVYVVLRHTDAYQYNNIWLNIGLQAPGDTMKFQKINVLLGNDANGWDGVGMNDIWEIRKEIARMLLQKGTYHFSISHIMRDNPLQNIMSVGLRLEKATN